LIILKLKPTNENGDSLRIAFIIPCFNEAERLDIKAFESFKSRDQNSNIDLYFVNDGSTDNTQNIIEKLASNQNGIHAIGIEKNVGKGEAIRKAMNKIIEEERYDYLGYLDADLATPIEETSTFQKYLMHMPKMIIGTRVSILGQTKIKRRAMRHYVGRIFATVVSNMLKLSIYDTQCGAKLIRQDIAKELFKEPFLSKWLFDVELFFRLKPFLNSESSELLEHPVSKWEDIAGSKIKASYFLIAPLDLLKIYFKYK